MQQPLLQKKPDGHGVPQGAPQSCWPGAHSWQRHSGGRVGLPTHTSQFSQGLRQDVTCVHGWQRFGSASVDSVHVPGSF